MLRSIWQFFEKFNKLTIKWLLLQVFFYLDQAEYFNYIDIKKKDTFYMPVF